MTALDNIFANMRKFSWESWNFLVQLVFTLFGVGLFYRAVQTETGEDTMWYYLLLATFFLGTAAVNCMFLRGGLRGFLALVHVAFNAYLIPFSFFSYGVGMSFAAAASVGYVLVTVAISPRAVGLVALLSGVFFALFQKAYYQGLGDNALVSITKITAAYIALALLGYCWRLVAQKMFELYGHAYVGGGDETPSAEQREQLAALERDNRMLKEEIAMHIIEIDKIVDTSKHELDK